MYLRMISIGRPRWGVFFGLITPRCPVFFRTTGKKFDVWAWTASLYEFVLFVWFSGMFSFHGSDYVDLTSARRKRSAILAANTKQNKFSSISEVKTYTSSVRPSVLADFVPYKIRFVLETPFLQNFNTFKKERIRNPQIKVRGFITNFFNRKSACFRKCHCAVSVKPLVFWRDFPCSVLELPRWVSQYGFEAFCPCFFQEVF